MSHTAGAFDIHVLSHWFQASPDTPGPHLRRRPTRGEPFSLGSPLKYSPNRDLCHVAPTPARKAHLYIKGLISSRLCSLSPLKALQRLFDFLTLVPHTRCASCGVALEKLIQRSSLCSFIQPIPVEIEIIIIITTTELLIFKNTRVNLFVLTRQT